MRLPLAVLCAALAVPAAFAVEYALEYTVYEAHEVLPPDMMRVDAIHLMEHGMQRYVVDGGIGVADGATFNMYPGMRDIPLQRHGDAGQGSITGAATAAEEHGATGKGVVIAVVDTGVDFSNPDIAGAVARDENNVPMMLDPDGQGIILTNATFYAHQRNGVIHNGSVPEGHTSGVYVNADGVFLDIRQNGEGTAIPVYNALYPWLGFEPVFHGVLGEDMKIGNSKDDHIVSKSGVYRLGVSFMPLFGPGPGVQLVPVLVTDSQTAGVYDTITPDMSTSWEDFTRFDLPEGERPDYDFDFTDEAPVRLGGGGEALVYDHDGDGVPDYSAGMLGARVLDVYGVITNSTTPEGFEWGAINATLLEPMDPGGEYVGIMTDFDGHGTAVAGVMVSRGELEYNLYNGTEEHTISGVAPDARVLPVKALWYGGLVYGWMWPAGMDNDGTGWTYSGQPRAHISSNSWGIPAFPLLEAAPGYDEVSVLANLLSTPGSLHDDYPGTIIVQSAGNSGHGYGTISVPSSSLSVVVGATTHSAYVGTPPFEGSPRFGNDTSHYGHVVDFSSRGPGPVGDPRPDVMATGAFGLAPASVTRATKAAEQDPYSLFGGTSMAAPLVAGSAALVLERLNGNGVGFDPFLVKNVLMSTAADLGNDPLVQGAGMVDAAAAVGYVQGEPGLFAVANDASYLNVLEATRGALDAFNHTAFGIRDVYAPAKAHPMASWFAGHLAPGERGGATFTITNPGEEPILVEVEPQRLGLVRSHQANHTTVPYQRDAVMNDTGMYAPNYVLLSEVRTPETLRGAYTPDTVPESSLLVLNVNFGFEDFMNATAEYADDMGIASLYLYDWNDGDGDGEISAPELAMVSRAGSWGTLQEMRVSHPDGLFEGVPVVGVYPVPVRLSYWSGTLDANVTAMNYTLTASYYDREAWDDVWVDTGAVTVPPKSQVEVRAVLAVPQDRGSGVYQGFLSFRGGSHEVSVPVSYAVAAEAGPGTLLSQPGDGDGPGVMYSPNGVRGAFDMGSSYENGDWRHHFVMVPEGAGPGTIEVHWQSNHTNLSVFVAGPSGELIQSNVEPGVFGHFAGWPSSDWLGRGAIGSGGYFPVNAWNGTFTSLHVPVDGPGMYSVMTHAAVQAGQSVSEPIQVWARFR